MLHSLILPGKKDLDLSCKNEGREEMQAELCMTELRTQHHRRILFLLSDYLLIYEIDSCYHLGEDICKTQTCSPSLSKLSHHTSYHSPKPKISVQATVYNCLVSSLIASSVELLKSGFLGANIIAGYLLVTAGEFIQLLCNDLFMSLLCTTTIDLPCAHILGQYHRKSATWLWVLWHRLLWKLFLFSSGIWPVLT